MTGPDKEWSGNLLARWQAGDQRAAEELFRRYASQLVEFARRRLPAKLTRRVDPEDVVQSVYRSFFANAREGCYELQRGGDLWRLLVTITLNKVYLQFERNAAGKRATEREQCFGDEDALRVHAAILSREPSPVDALVLADQLEQLMSQLPPPHRRILELRLQGFKLEEIAAQLDCGQRTVRRVLERIKLLLKQWRETGPGQ